MLHLEHHGRVYNGLILPFTPIDTPVRQQVVVGVSGFRRLGKEEGRFEVVWGGSGSLGGSGRVEGRYAGDSEGGNSPLGGCVSAGLSRPEASVTDVFYDVVLKVDLRGEFDRRGTRLSCEHVGKLAAVAETLANPARGTGLHADTLGAP